MKVGKPKSKRVPVRLRHKIQKAGAAKERKNRKLAKKDITWHSKLKKDPGIPNLFPYKEKILQEIEERKRQKDEENARRREENRSRRGEPEQAIIEDHDIDGEILEEEGEDGLMDDDMGDDSNPMAALLASARARAAEYDGVGDDVDEMEEDESDEDDWNGVDESSTQQPTKTDSSRKAYDKIFKQVIDSADVVLYVLDARDPEGTRSKEVERQIMSAASGDKRLILILNKIDLIPPPVLKAWLVHLRRFFPTLPLRASNPAPNAKTFDHKQLTVKGTSEALFHALKSYAQSKSLKRSISVGIIGYPNVGKSSVINALTARLGGRTAACPVGAEAGVTTSLREVKLDNKLKLLDSPGIVFPSTAASKKAKIEEQARLVLLNAVPPKEMTDLTPAVTLLLRRMSSSPAQFQKLLDTYELPPLMTSANGDMTTDFLVQVARKRGRLGKGGVPNLVSAAQAVVTDWRDGRIQGWQDAPDVLRDAQDGKEGADQVTIVKEWAEEFKLEGLWGDDGADAMEGNADEVMA